MENESNLKRIDLPEVKSEFEEYLSKSSYDLDLLNGSLNEAELCTAYSYERSMSPPMTAIPKVEDECSWLSDEVSQAETLTNETEQYDLLETDLFGCKDSKSLDHEPSRPLSPVKVGERLMDHHHEKCDANINMNLNTPINGELSIDSHLSVRPSHSSVEPTQAVPMKNSLLKSTNDARALTRKMTLRQKMKFQAWLNSGLSIEEAADKSKIPDLIIPLVRHPNCQFPMRKLRRLSESFPTVNLKRQFIYETYFAGRDPEVIMKYLLSNVNSKDLISTCERQFTLELAIEEKKGRRAAITAGSDASLTAKRSGVEDTNNITAKDTANVNRPEFKMYCYWRSKGLSVMEAKSNAQVFGVVDDALPHPRCRYSWEKLLELSRCLSDSMSKERFLIEVFYRGKNPAEVLAVLTAGMSGIQPHASHAASDSYHTERQSLPQKYDEYSSNVNGEEEELCRNSTRDFGINYLVAQRQTREEALSNLENPSKELMEELDDVVLRAGQTEQEIVSRDSLAVGGNSLESHRGSKNVPLGSRDHPSNFLNDNQLVNYYLLIGSGCSRDVAMKSAKTPGLATHNLFRRHHLMSKSDFQRVQSMSKQLPTRALAKRFVTEVYYGGNDPEETMKFLLSSGSAANDQELPEAYGVASNPGNPPDSPNPIHQVSQVATRTFTSFVDPVRGLHLQSHGHLGQVNAFGSAHSDEPVSPPVHGTGASRRFSSDVHPRPPTVHQVTNPLLMNNSREDNIERTSHFNVLEYQSGNVTLPASTMKRDLELPTHFVRTTGCEPPKVSHSDPKRTNSEVKCFIAPTNYPKEYLNNSQMDAIENNLLEAILEVEEEHVAPSFINSFRSNGRYGVTCDEFSLNWLSKYVKMYTPIEGASLKLMIDEPRTIRANAVFPLCKCDDDDDRILKFIEKQNYGLYVSRWTVVQRWNNNGNTLMDLKIDKESAEVLLKSNRINFKLGSAEINVAEDDGPQADSQNAVELPRSETPTLPPLPPSPPAPSPPAPPLPEQPSVIDTSLGGLLFGTVSKSGHQEHAQAHDELVSRPGRSRKKTTHRHKHKRRKRRGHGSSSDDQKRSDSRSSSLDSVGRSIRRLRQKIGKRRHSKKEHSRSRTRKRSTSRDGIHRKTRRGISQRPRSPSGVKGREVSFFYKDTQNDKSTHPERLMTPISIISSDSDFSVHSSDTPADSAKRLERAGSCENMEYAQYLTHT